MIWIRKMKALFSSPEPNYLLNSLKNYLEINVQIVQKYPQVV